MKTRIAVSAGHDMNARGACHEGRCEWPETRIWAELVAQLLSRDYSVMLAPEDKLVAKVAALNSYKPELAVEIHFNAGGTASTNGCESVYFPGSENGIRLAKLMQQFLVPAMGNNDRGIKEGWYRQDRPGVVDFEGDVDGDEKLLYFLKETKCPAVIVEPEFVQQFVNIEAKRVEGAKAIASAIRAYFEAGTPLVDMEAAERGVEEEPKLEEDEVPEDRIPVSARARVARMRQKRKDKQRDS